MKRAFDIFLGILILPLIAILSILIYIFIKFSSDGSPIYWSDRIGKDNVLFSMPKFRTMYLETPEVASDKLKNPEKFITPIGVFLRRYSLDELPQLYSVLCGDMSFVGPRPALHNQEKLISDRTKNGISALKPGITGWAQINGRDEISDKDKTDLDIFYKNNQSIFFDLKIILRTMKKVLKRENITH